MGGFEEGLEVGRWLVGNLDDLVRGLFEGERLAMLGLEKALVLLSQTIAACRSEGELDGSHHSLPIERIVRIVDISITGRLLLRGALRGGISITQLLRSSRLLVSS